MTMHEKDCPAEYTPTEDANHSGAETNHQPEPASVATPTPRVDGFSAPGDLLDRITALDAEWFNQHPDTNEYWRDAYPVEIELMDKDAAPQQYGKLRMHVQKNNDWVHTKAIFQREGSGIRCVGIGAAIYPNRNIDKLVASLRSEESER
jgi:hypothetical protein